MRAGEAITAEEAVRRVLVLENPALRGQSAITQSLYAGLQLILPGEVAPSSRHERALAIAFRDPQHGGRSIGDAAEALGIAQRRVSQRVAALGRHRAIIRRPCRAPVASTPWQEMNRGAGQSAGRRPIDGSQRVYRRPNLR